MKERGIIMSADEVLAVLDGRKTQLRRKVSDKHIPFIEDMTANFLDGRWEERPFPFGRPGDRLWVRETWRQFNATDECSCSESPCGCPVTGTVLYRSSHDDGVSRWRPSIHMPRWASRITLEITGVRIERVQDITEKDAIAEGARYFPDLPSRHPYGQDCRWSMGNPETTSDCLSTARHAFGNSWVKRYGKSQFDTRLWDENPWVWVIEFKTVEVQA